MDEILSCPWCKGQSVISGILKPAYVECNECEAIGPEKPTPEEAIKVWNDMSIRCNNISVGLKIHDSDDGGPYELDPTDIKFDYDPIENSKKYELPKTNAVKFEHDGKPHIRLPQDEFDNVIDHLLAWQAILISKEYKDRGIKPVELKISESDDENDEEVNDA